MSTHWADFDMRCRLDDSKLSCTFICTSIFFAR